MDPDDLTAPAGQAPADPATPAAAPDTVLADQIQAMVKDGVAAAMAAYQPPAPAVAPAAPAPPLAPNEQAIQAIAAQLKMDSATAKRWFSAAALAELAPQMPQSAGLQSLLDQRQREAQTIDGLRGVNGELATLKTRLEEFEQAKQLEKNAALYAAQVPALLEARSPEVKILTDAAPTVISNTKVQKYVIQELSANRGDRLPETLRLIEAMETESRPQPRGMAAGPATSGPHPLAGLDMSQPGAEEKLVSYLNSNNGVH